MAIEILVPTGPTGHREGGSALLREQSSDDLTILLSGWDRVWAMRTSLSVPFSDLTEATVEARSSLVEGVAMRVRGSTIPGRVVAGMYSYWSHRRVEKGDRQFWVAYRAEELLVLNTAVARPRQIVIEVDDPRAMATALNGLVALANSSSNCADGVPSDADRREP